MATWFIRPDVGTDSNASTGNGDSYATARKSISNVVAAALAPGDSIKIAKSPDPVSLGVNGTWTNRVPSAAISISSSTNATPIVVTTSSNHGLSAGDTVIIGSHSTNTKANGVWKVGSPTSTTFQLLHADGTNSTGNGTGGATGSVQDITGSVVTLASALTKPIASIGNRGELTNWTASANVTCSINTTNFKQGGESQQIAVAAGFTTGLAAYFTLPLNSDFSAYNKISFWIRQSSGTLISSGQVQIKLCSDMIGAVAVNTINFPAVGVLNRWQAVTVDTGAALGNIINSIAVYVVTDSGAQTFVIDDIFACNSLHLQSAIGKSSGNYLFPQSIDNVCVVIDGPSVTSVPTLSAFAGSYQGVSETVAAYVQTMFSLAIATSISTQIQVVNDDGSAGSPITITGGWDTASSMTTQTGKTWFDGQNGSGYGLVFQTRSYVTMNDETISFCRYYRGISMAANTECLVKPFALNQNDSLGISAATETNSTLGAKYIEFNNIGISGGSNASTVFDYCNSSASYNILPGDNITIIGTDCNGAIGTANLYFNGSFNVRALITNIKNSYAYGIFNSLSFGIECNGSTLSGNVTADLNCSSMHREIMQLSYCNLQSSTPVASMVSGALQQGGAFLKHYNLGALDHRYYLNNGNVFSETSVKYNPLSLYSWKISPTVGTTFVGDKYPFLHKLGVVKLKSGNNEISAQLRRTNTGISGRLVVHGGSAAGISAEVSDSITASADTWEKLVLSVSPTADCEVSVWVEAFGGTTYSVYADDLQVKRGSFSGNISESEAIDTWVIRAVNALDNSFAGYAESTGATYSIDVNTSSPCHLILEPKITCKWTAGRTNTSGDFCIPTNPESTPHIFKCTTGGASHATTEPTWNLSGTTTDNTTTWTYVGPFASAILGPKIPTLL